MNKQDNTQTNIKRQLERRIERTRQVIKDYEAREEELSKHGQWSLGYYKGKLYVLEEWLDSIIEQETGEEELPKK